MVEDESLAKRPLSAVSGKKLTDGLALDRKTAAAAVATPKPALLLAPAIEEKSIKNPSHALSTKGQMVSALKPISTQVKQLGMQSSAALPRATPPPPPALDAVENLDAKVE